MAAKLTLQHIQLENFGRHEELAIKLSERLTVIKGENGSGKSTLLQAIFFAFFGVSAVDGKASDIPRHGAKTAAVELMFRLGEQDYYIRRTLKDATLVKYIAPDDKQDDIVATGTTSVNEWVERNLGVSQKVFMQLTYSPQTETAAIMSIGAATLNRMVEQIAEADFISQVEKKSSEFSLSADMQLASLEKPADTGELHVKLMEATMAKTGSAVAFKIAEEEFNAAEGEYKQHGAVVRAEQDKDTKARHWRTEIVDIDKSIVAAQTLMDKALADLARAGGSQESLDLARQHRDECLQTAKTLREGLQEAVANNRRQNEITNWLEGTRKTRNQYNEVVPKIDAAHVLLDEKTKARDQVRLAVTAANGEIRVIEDTIEKAACSKCERPFDTAALEKAKADLTAQMAKWSKLKEGLTAAQYEMDSARNAYHALDAQKPPYNEGLYVERERELAKLKETAPKAAPTVDDVRAAEEELTKAADKVAEAKTALNAREHAEAEHKLAKAKLDRAKDLKEKATTELSELGEVNYAAAQEKHGVLFEAFTRTQATYSETKTKHDSNTLAVTAYEKEIEKAEQLMTKRAAAERRKASFAGLTKYLRENRETFMATLWDQLMHLTSEFVATVTEGRISAIMRGDSGDFVYVENGEQRAYARLAGGFKAVAGVGLRIALASLLPAGVSLVVLDEPSSELRDDIATALAAALRGTDRQIVLVTHRVGEEYASDQVIELTV